MASNASPDRLVSQKRDLDSILTSNMRLLVLLHRYLGIAVGLIVAAWCVSGIVMLYMRYPELDEDRRLQALQPLAWQDCCAFDAVATALDVNVFRTFNVEMLAGRPMLFAAQVGGPQLAFDLRSGARLSEVAQSQAIAVAQQYVRALNIRGQPQYLGQIARDQWTVSGAFNGDRPLHKFGLRDAADTELYISNGTGRVVQHTTARQRLWNWCGAVVHWLYPTVLRQNGTVWAQVVIWLSIVGLFLTVVGIYLGVMQWRAAKNSWSPYRGAHKWHHASGLFFGLFTLTWLGSGLVSMSPWGFLAGSSAQAEQERLTDFWIDGKSITDSIKAAASVSNGITRLAAAPFDGQLYLLGYRGTQVQRLDAKLAPAPPTQLQVERAATLLAGGLPHQVELLTAGDDYYYSGHEQRSLPVYRVVLNDRGQNRYYLNADSLQLIDKIDTERRWYRWLFEGLHRFDFAAALRQRPWWDVLMLTLLGGVTVGAFTGVYIGYRRLRPKRS
jgi:hypothetical protein